jgi:small nuclear ribonucleoprotein (snRNP)-like protein
VFWTGLFTAAGGIAGGGIGYATSRLQHGIQRDQLKLEERRHENEGILASRAMIDTRREQRRQIYLGYLETVDAIMNLVMTPAVDQETLHAYWAAFVKADNELELAGNDAIKDASYPVNQHVTDLVGEHIDRIDDPSLEYPDDSDLHSARAEIVALIREDLLPDEPG